jgi:SAM-dependent methyltransferase
MKPDRPTSQPEAALPDAARIGAYYDQRMREIGGEYIHRRWGDSAVKRRHYGQTRVALLAALERVPRFDEVLEVGCGPAVWTELYLPRARRVELFDVSEEMLAAARQRVEGWESGRFASRVTYRRGDAARADLGRQQFDAVLSMRAFEYLSDKPGFLLRCQSALRPGGWLVLGTKNGRWYDMVRDRRRQARRGDRPPPIQDAMQADLVDPDSLRRLVRGAGLVVHGVFPLVFGSYHQPFTWRLGLAFCDALHRHRHRRPAGALITPLMESMVVVAERPAGAG